MIIRDVEEPKSKSKEMLNDIILGSIYTPHNLESVMAVAGGISNNVAGGDVKSQLKDLVSSQMALYGLDNSIIRTYQEPINPMGTTLSPILFKPSMDEQYSNIQEELSKLTRIYNQERKEHVEILKEKDKQIAKLQKEKDQVQKKLARAKAKAKTYKDELDIKNKLVEVSADVDDLQDRMRRAEDVLHIKEEGV